MNFIGRTHPGRIRSNNEDALAFNEKNDVAVLADGMGGLEAGEIASHAAVEAVLEHLNGDVDEQSVTASILAANERVRHLAMDRKSLGNMGTTLVLWAAADAERCVVAHVGDSRAYRYANGRLSRLTSDHSVVQRMVDAGLLTAEEAMLAPNRNIITRAVGLETLVEPDVHEVSCQPGDRFLLCSDGLTDLLSDARIAEILERGNSAAVADELISAANDAGGMDNISVLLIGPVGGNGAGKSV